MNQEEALTYVSKEPDVKVLRKAYETTRHELESFMQQCRENYDDRRNYWPGKTRDLRKHGPAAFPWEGASDLEAHVIDERINSYVAMMMVALSRANIRAYPVEANDAARARVVSSFLKWMVHSYIPRFYKEMELAANMLLERGILVSYVGWQREDRSYLQSISLDQIAQVDPTLAQKVIDGSADEELIAMVRQVYPSVSEKRAKKALKELRKKGVAEIPVSRRQVDAPLIETLTPDGDFLFPAYVTDPQRAPYCFWRTYYTPQELRNKVSTEGWNEDWVEHVIQHYRGVDVSFTDRTEGQRRSIALNESEYEANDLVEVIYGYQRLIDEEDGAEGIYCTIFHKNFSGNDAVDGFAKFELLNGFEDYPVVVTKLFEDSKRLYDVQAFPELLRGHQMQVKIERDSRVDRNSMATLPPIMHPVGNPPTEWAPGAYVPYRRGGEFQFGPQPPYNQGSIEMESTMLRAADGIVGLNAEDPLSDVKRQFFVSKFLMHVQQVVKQAFKAFQRFGPDSIWFRVTGVPDPMQFEKGNPDESFDIMVGYDVLNNDPENMESKLQQMVSLLQIDKNGRIDVDRLLDVVAGAIDPILADAVLMPAEEASQQIVKFVTDDLAKIFAGIEMPARPNGAQIAMQTIQQYASQEDVMARLQQDEAFKGRLEKYMAQYQMMAMQAQNAQIGRIGTQPAAMGDVATQNLNG